MEQSNRLDIIPKPQEKRWLLENFASRAALLGFIYLCVNIIYQQGYLSKLGLEFGLFSIARTLPILFDNFLIAAYAFIVWGFIAEVTLSTYDQLFGFFNPVSWRDRNVKKLRIVAIVGVLIFYIGLHTVFLIQRNQISPFPVSRGNFLSTLFSGNLITFWISLVNTLLVFWAFLVKLLIPTWNFIFWWPSFLSVLGLLLMFNLPNKKYRLVRNMGFYQLLKKNREFMFFQINLITPAFSILAGFFFLVMFPGFVGSETAYLTIKNIHASGYQQVDRIELSNVNSFCGENVVFIEDTATWEKSNKDKFTIHLLGSIGGYDLFIKITDQFNAGNANVLPKDNVNYVSCLITSGSFKSIVFNQNIFQ